MPIQPTSPSRRAVLGALAAAALPGVSAAEPGTADPAVAPSAAGGGAAPLQERGRWLEALVKLRGNLDGRVGFAWQKGLRYAKVGADIEPMCGLLHCSIVRYRRMSADEFDMRLYELSFYTDPETFEYRPKLAMPFSRRVVDVPLYRTGPGRHVVKLQNREEMSWSKRNTTSEAAARALAPDGKILYEVRILPPVIQQDNVWMSTEARTRLEPNDPAERRWTYEELITHQGRLSELMDPATRDVASTMSYSLVMDWRPWMQLGDFDGHTFDHGVGGRVWTLDALPGEIREHLARHHPDVVADPPKWLGT